MTAEGLAIRPDARSLGAIADVPIAMPIAAVVASIPSPVALSGDRDAVPVVPWAGAPSDPIVCLPPTRPDGPLGD